MDEEKEEFLPNPFSQLDPARFPDRKKDLEEGKENADPLLQEKEYFLANVSRFKPEAKENTQGFSLAERGLKLKMVKPGEPQAGAEEKAKRAQREVVKKGAEEKAEETDQFLWAMRDAKPLKNGGRKVQPERKMRPNQAKEADFASLVEENLEFALLNADEYLEGYVKGIDEGVLNRLRAGQYGIEAHLDLHGLNSVQAFGAMRDFIRECWFKGMRTVLLVPGRGHNSPNGISVLRQKIQYWLTHEPFKGVVLAFCTARPQDGGPGSVYVLLRVNRKKGGIYWERLPPDPDLYL